MEIVELILDEENEDVSGIEAISIVENPAIESDFIKLANQEIKFAKINDEKRILMGAALIPNKPIFRKRNDTNFYVYFSKDTVRKASELFFMNSNQNNATLEHKMNIQGLSVVESWLVEDTKMDKSHLYGLEVPEGTWMISMKVNNDEIWNDYVKENKVRGFSIEGYFADKAQIKKDKKQLSKIDESELKVEQIKKLISQFNLNSVVVNEDYAIIDDRLAYKTKEKAIEIAKNMGCECEGFHVHEFEGKEWFMPCETHDFGKYDCPEGYVKDWKKHKCVKKSEYYG
jgi:hypothetical protein